MNPVGVLFILFCWILKICIEGNHWWVANCIIIPSLFLSTNPSYTFQNYENNFILLAAYRIDLSFRDKKEKDKEQTINHLQLQRIKEYLKFTEERNIDNNKRNTISISRNGKDPQRTN